MLAYSDDSISLYIHMNLRRRACCRLQTKSVLSSELPVHVCRASGSPIAFLSKHMNKIFVSTLLSCVSLIYQ